MKNLDLNIQFLNQEAVEALFNVENEIRNLTGCSDLSISLNKLIENELNEASTIYEGYLTSQAITDGLFSDDYYSTLYELKELRAEINFCLAMNFLQNFPHRRECMSLNYISKQLSIADNILDIWFRLEEIPVINKKSGKYVAGVDFFEFYKTVSNRNYELNICFR